MLKKQRLIYLSAFLIFVYFFAACQFKPKEVMSERKMERVMYDIYVAEAIIGNDYSTFDIPEKKEAFIQQVFEKHGISKMEWDSSLAYYSDHIDKYIEMNDSVKVRLKRDQKILEEEIRQEGYDGIEGSKKWNLWSVMKKDALGSEIPLVASSKTPDFENGFSFDKDSLWIAENIPDNKFNFRFNMLGLSEFLETYPISMLILNYKDTTIYKYEEITENKHYETLISKYIDGDTLQSLSGFIHITDTQHKNILIYNILLGAPSEDTQESTKLESPTKKISSL